MKGPPPPRKDAAIWPEKAVLWSPYALLAGTVAILVWRRLAGGLQTPATWPAALLAGLFLCGLAGAVRWSARRAVGSNFPWPRWVPQAVVSAMVVLAGASLTLGNSPVATAMALWIPLAIGETWAWSPRRSPRGSRRSRPAADGKVVQRLTRHHLPGGKDAIQGLLVCSLAPGQRTGSFHVSFCPPLAGCPNVGVQQVSGPRARVRVGLALAQGARFDVRLTEHAGLYPHLVVLRFTASG